MLCCCASLQLEACCARLNSRVLKAEKMLNDADKQKGP